MLDLSHYIDPHYDLLGRNLQEAARSHRYAVGSTHPVERLARGANWSAVSWLAHWSERGRLSLRERCRTALESVGDVLGVGLDAFEVLLPDFGFSGGLRKVDYGLRGELVLRFDHDRRLTVHLGPKQLSSIPGPLKGDDTVRISRTRESIIGLRAELKRAARLVEERQDWACRTGHAWAADRWASLVRKPLYLRPATHRLWGFYSGSRLEKLFGLDECGEPVDVRGSAVEVPSDSLVRIVEPMSLSDEDRRVWSVWFAERGRLTDQLDPRGRVQANEIPYRERWWPVPHEHLDILVRLFRELGWSIRSPLPAADESYVRALADKSFSESGPYATVVVGTIGFVRLDRLHFGTEPYEEFDADTYDPEEDEWLDWDEDEWVQCEVPEAFIAEVALDLRHVRVHVERELVARYSE